MTNGAVVRGTSRSAVPVLDGRKSNDDFRPCDMAMKKYPTVWAARPADLTALSYAGPANRDVARSMNPVDIEMNARVSRSRFGLPTAE